jgi:hypothetical protein
MKKDIIFVIVMSRLGACSSFVVYLFDCKTH